jgi:glycosyltransferase involved in cell wall biosynthesis
MGIEVVYGLHSFGHYIQKYGQYIDIAVLSRPDISIHYIDILRSCSRSKIVYLPIDLHFLRIQREARVKGDPDLLKEADEWRAIEFDLIRKSDMTWVFSTAEKEVLEKEIPDAKAEVSPWIQVPHAAGKDFSEKQGLVFIAGFAHPPNEDGILWFAKEVFPSVANKIPGIKLTILGSNPTDKVLSLNSDSIRVIGFVKDPSPYFSDARVFISPLRFGAGLKGKILNAISYGLPVVSSSIGTEGMGLEDERDVLVADHAEEFAEKVARVYQDEGLWRRLSENGLSFLRRHFSVEHARKRFEALFASLEGTACGKTAAVPEKQTAGHPVVER